MNRLHSMELETRREVREVVASELAGEFAIVFAYLHGSFLENSSFHDVDVGVYLDPTAEAGAVEYCLALAERLSRKVSLPVDVRPLNQSPFTFLYHVLRGELLLSRDDELLGDVIEKTVRRYLDIAPLLRQSTVEAFGS